MEWTIRRAPGFSRGLDQYELDLTQRFHSALTESAAEEVITENRLWRAFNEALNKYEIQNADPAKHLPPYLKRPQFWLLKKGHFVAVYHRDPVSMEAVAVIFMDRSTSSKNLKETLEELKAI